MFLVSYFSNAIIYKYIYVHVYIYIILFSVSYAEVLAQKLKLNILHWLSVFSGVFKLHMHY